MRIKDDYFLVSKPIAHRGLWGNAVPENSMLAYKLAADKGIPIEIDVFLTTDNQIVSFHDNTLVRMTGETGKIYEKSYAELSKLRLSGSEYTIPLLTDIFKVVEGKSPLLIEIKNQPNKLIVDELIKLLDSYKGEFAIQSFNPIYIYRVKKLRPDIIRGILATKNKEDLSSLKHFIVKNMALNFLIKPDFISYEQSGYPLKKSKTKNKRLIAWTVTSATAYEKLKPYIDNVIYENFEIK